MAYAYRDQHGILHVVPRQATADEAAKGGKVVTYDGLAEYGFPIINVPSKDKKTSKIFDYGNGEVYVGGNKNSGTPLGKCTASVQAMVNDMLAKIGI